MRKVLTALLVAMALMPAVASATPTASLTSPSDNDCIGGTAWPVKGQATGTAGPDFYWDLTLRRTDTGAILSDEHHTSGTIITLSALDTTVLPVNVQLAYNLVVHDGDGTATANRVFTPRLDRVAPQKTDVTAVYAVSWRQVWVELSNSFDLGGCAGGIQSYKTWTDGFSLSNTTDQNGVVNGSAHDALSQPVLSGNTDYMVRGVVTDRADVVSPTGLAKMVRTSGDIGTILAGHVRGQGKPLFGIRVTATKGTYSTSTVTDGSGWYRLQLPEIISQYTVRYEPSGLPLSATGWGVAIDTVTTPNEYGRILPHHKVLTP